MTSPNAPARGALRVLRGGALAVTSATLAVTAHVIGGGAAPATGLVVLLTLLVAAAGTALADRRRSGRAILGALAVSHLSIHTILMLSCSMSDADIAWPAMVTAHLVAVLCTAILLTKAESAIFAVAAALAMLLPRPLPPPAVRSRQRPPHPAPDTCWVLDVLLRRVVARRGPPACC